MLFMPPGQAEPVRIQGTFVSTDDTERLMDWYRAKAEEEEARKAAEEDILDAVHQREVEEAELVMAEPIPQTASWMESSLERPCFLPSSKRRGQ